MKKRWILLAAPLVMCAVTNSAVAGLDCCFSPYMGADAQMRHMRFQEDFGGNTLKKKYPQGNFFAGLKFNQCVGIEFGYETSKKKSRSVHHNSNDSLFGLPLLQADLLVNPRIDHRSHSSSRINGWNANLMGFLPVLCEDNSLQLVGSLGIAQLKVKTKNRLTTIITENIFDPETLDVIGTQLVPFIRESRFQKRKAVLRVSGGIQNMLNDCIGIRALVTWENTARLKARGRDLYTREILSTIAKPKNSLIYGLGMFVSI